VVRMLAAPGTVDVDPDHYLKAATKAALDGERSCCRTSCGVVFDACDRSGARHTCQSEILRSRRKCNRSRYGAARASQSVAAHRRLAAALENDPLRIRKRLDFVARNVAVRAIWTRKSRARHHEPPE
jgi:hypothetical protein